MVSAESRVVHVEFDKTHGDSEMTQGQGLNVVAIVRSGEMGSALNESCTEMNGTNRKPNPSTRMTRTIRGSRKYAANHGAALAYHWDRDDDPTFDPADYQGPVVRYQSFLARYDALFHPAQPWSQLGLVYPRRAERAGDAHCLQQLHWFGALLEDRQQAPI